MRILHALNAATDVVISHFHGDHLPLADANPYQLSMRDLPHRRRRPRCWSKSDDDLSEAMRKRRADLLTYFVNGIHAAEGCSHGPLSFSQAVPHGVPRSALGTVMMTRIESGGHVFVHASDIQLLNDAAVAAIIDWRPTTVLAAGPPLYLDRLGATERRCAWQNALRLVESVNAIVLDHHLMRDARAPAWLDDLSRAAGKRVYCAADFMGKPRRLLEAQREQLYADMPVPSKWHERYARGAASIETYFDGLRDKQHNRIGTVKEMVPRRLQPKPR
ncbi:MAG: hypothetical protein P8Y27_08120 [Chromatiaceae bacterium]|jgi:hypothetical protein